MKILLVGGGSGGHFYPLLAVAESLERITREKKLIEPDLYYTGPAPFDPAALLEHEIHYYPSPAGKIRRYPSLLNIAALIVAAWGTIVSIFQLFRIYPDVIFSTGGYAAFPTLAAARILSIPVIVYDADAFPGRVSLWSARFARFVAVAHPDAAEKFPQKLLPKIARTGHPIREEIEAPAREGGHEFLKLDTSVPTVFFIGGSQGAQKINETVLDSLPRLVERYNIVHQTGAANFEEVSQIAKVELKDSRYADRYRPFGLLNALALRMTGGIASVVVSRAGSGSIFEIASWGIPAILVPIPKEVSHDQLENAFSYARAGGAAVLEQHNLTPHLLVAEIDRLMSDEPLRQRMSAAAKNFSRPDAARKIAERIIETALSHESV
ncbi:MAG: UDP-N-acetylglucosamine--N-acetylmuramyl-(pentapeptide) pyrophosphoryl-undecaprenol N-acetylglucosamine transferase [Candidatus Kaiserbacteria bacterium]|nr:MAG: UDP-N-acetylglucosamine--N-acetylmuramyl-(pentapeptide) pyrophosphoryl-undecaprenol N-acetylglucosamine transferase [Candidatus Kaiserbacteria bacterium]